MANSNERERAAAVDPLVADFRTPSREYGPVPLWWWDGADYDEERTTWQLERLNKAGVPSVCYIQKYPNGPTGDDHDYFSEEWWAHMEYVAEECDRLDMNLWVHDETYHHSPPTWREFWQDYIKAEASERPELRGRVLDRVSEDVIGPGEVVLELPHDFSPMVLAAYPRKDGTLRLDEAVELDATDGRIGWTAPAGEWHVAAVGTCPRGLCYTTRDAVDRYIDLHFEEYVRRLGDLVGEVLVGTFEDELIILDDEVPCDERVLRRFRQEKGYDPTEQLIGLYEDVDERTAELRTDYYDVVTSLLEENWFEPLYEWHEEHGLLRAHDNWGRNDLTEQMTQYGDYYRTMRWYQVPGYDDGGPEALGSRNFFDAKLAASIAACYDRDRVWGELFHSTGWGFTPEAQLGGIVENFCYGANLYDKHGLYYTSLGGWWEHAPPDVHFRQPYWDHIGDLHDATTRLSFLFGQGTPVVDVAMLYPSTSLHADWRPDEGIATAGEEIDESTRKLAERLYETGSDLVIADHESLAGAANANGALEIGQMRIPVLLLGPTTAVRRSVLRTVRECYDRGGVVVAVGQLPSIAVGEGDEQLDDVLDHVFGENYPTAQRGEIESVTRIESESGGVGVLAAFDTDLTGLLDEVIDRDVRTDAPALYRTHRRIGDRDMYLLFNARDKERTVTVGFRAEGRPRRWNVLTGAVEPIWEYDRDGAYTRVGLSFEPHGFHVVSVESGTGEPRLLTSSLATVTEIDEVNDGDIRVQGTTRTDGTQSIQAILGGGRYEGTSNPVSVPEERDVSEGWTFTSVPVLDNQWGDFRYPPSKSTIGPEVRKFHHRAERPGEDGIERGWFRPAAETDDWEWVSWSYGPYFWLKTGVRGDDPGPTPNESDDEWQSYTFSKRFGTPGTHPYLLGYTSVVSDNYLVSPESEGTNYFWTTVRAPESGTVVLHYGPGIQRIRVGEQTITPDYEQSIGGLVRSARTDDGETAIIHLPEGTTPLLLAVEPGIETFVVVEPTPGVGFDRDVSYVPRVRWFQDESAFEFDYQPWDSSPIGWYRFEVPAGTRRFTLPSDGNPSHVWINGIDHPVTDDEVTFETPLEESTAVAVRIEQCPGRYGGAAWNGPVQVETGPVETDVGKWDDLGLTPFSGIGRYRRKVSLPDVEPNDRVLLDLGSVAVSAAVWVNGKPIGATFARPFTFDISEEIQPGENEIEIGVANTLASHFAQETPRRYAIEAVDYFADVPELLPTVGNEEIVSGLLGPVTVRIEPAVTIRAERS